MGKIAFLFPGQGAQYIGMGQSLYENYATSREVYDTCGAIKKGQSELSGDAIAEISWNGTKEDLLPTKIAQPAIFLADLAAAMALYEALKERGVVPDGAAGFSLGEIPALAFAGMLPLRAAYEFVCFRAIAMYDATQQHRGGMMAVLGLSSEAVEGICAKVGAWPVNYNAPGQIVAAYKSEAENPLKEAVTAARGKALILPVAGAFHSPLMDDAAGKIAEYLTGVRLRKPTIPLYSNVTAQPYSSNAEKARGLLAQQVNSPVRWQATIENMLADGFDTFIETGPGKALSGMVKKISQKIPKDVRTFNVYDFETLEGCVENV